LFHFRPLFFLSSFLVSSASCLAVDLKPETVAAFDKFTAAAEKRLEPAFLGHEFLWFDTISGIRQQLQNGAAIAQPVPGNAMVSLKGGLVQDWRAAVFIPQVSLQDVLAIVQDYPRHHEFYKPDVADARIESRQDDQFIVSMRIVKSKFMVTDVLHTENEIRFTHLDSHRAYSRSYSTRINEIASPGQPGEHQLPAGHDRGLLWRLYGYWFFEERDGGVYVACESITLTRDIPFGMGAILGPVFRDLPGESLRKSMEQTRRAVLAIRPHTVSAN
jgi:hypothetical protein